MLVIACVRAKNEGENKIEDSKVKYKGKLEKNFVQENIFDAINLVAQKSAPAKVDTRYGSKQALSNSGLQLQYARKKDYGQLPPYLLKRKHEQKLEQKNYKQYLTDKEQQSPAKRLSNEERSKILKGLKDNWSLLNYQYLSISLTLDSHSKQKRKSILETKMHQLEKYMEVLQNFDIFVKDD